MSNSIAFLKIKETFIMGINLGRIFTLIIGLLLALYFSLGSCFCETYLNEPFDSQDDLNNWEDHTGSYFGLNYDFNEDAAHIYEITGHWGHKAYICRTVSVAGWEGTMILDLDDLIWEEYQDYL